MNRTTLSCAAIFVIAIASCGGRAVAQLRSLSSTRDGSGTLKFSSRSATYDVRRVSVSLQSNGDFEIRILSGANETWRGSWSARGDREARLDVQRMGNDEASGSGTVELNGRGSFDRITLGIGGSSGYSLDFSSGASGGPQPPDPGDWTSMNSTRSGRGTLKYSSRTATYDVKRVLVSLQSTGDFEIRILSGSRESWRGRWSQRGDREARLDVQRMGNNQASGSGTVELNGRGSFDRVTVGNGGGTGYSLDFRSGSGGSRPPDQGEWKPMSSTMDGSGTLRYASRSAAYDVRRVSISLQDNGDFEIRALSGANETWRGRWSAKGDREARLEVQRMGNSQASGSGTVELDGRGGFDRVTIGNGGGGGYSLDFRSGSGGSRPPDGGNRPPSWNGSVVDAGKQAVERAIYKEISSRALVQFTSATSRRLSSSEQIVSGSGLLTRVPGHRAEEFDYSVKVDTRTGETWDVVWNTR